jgi:hypothetical protein
MEYYLTVKPLKMPDKTRFIDSYIGNEINASNNWFNGI